MSPTKKPMTKSLHTVTAVANVAALLRSTTARHACAAELAAEALAVLGYDIADFAKSDDTIVRCVAACAKLGAAA
jgi:hypothetical protein